MKRGSCLIALLWWAHRGGYLIVRSSRNHRLPWLKWPHFLWAKSLGELEVHQFVPDDVQPRYLPPILFRGRVKVGPDKEDA